MNVSRNLLSIGVIASIALVSTVTASAYPVDSFISSVTGQSVIGRRWNTEGNVKPTVRSVKRMAQENAPTSDLSRTRYLPPARFTRGSADWTTRTAKRTEPGILRNDSVNRLQTQGVRSKAVSCYAKHSHGRRLAWCLHTVVQDASKK